MDIFVYFVNNTIHVSEYSGVWVKRFCLQPRPQTDHKFTVLVMLLIFMGSLSLMHNSEMKAVSSLSYKYIYATVGPKPESTERTESLGYLL